MIGLHRRWLTAIIVLCLATFGLVFSITVYSRLHDKPPIVEIKTVETNSTIITLLHKAVVTNVHDGDTFTCNIDLGWGHTWSHVIRIEGFDAWELTKVRRTVEVSDEEIIKGKEARDALQSILKLTNGVVYLRESKSHDPYGRLLVKAFVERQGEFVNVGDLMQEGGHGRKN